MKTNYYSSAAVLLGILWLNVKTMTAQEIPLVYDAENSVAPFEVTLPGMEELPVIETLPDPFAWSDGSGRSTRFGDWGRRRMEIGAEIQDYEIGRKPERPDSLTADYRNDTLRVHITVNGKTLTLTSPVILPEGEGPVSRGDRHRQRLRQPATRPLHFPPHCTDQLQLHGGDGLATEKRRRTNQPALPRTDPHGCLQRLVLGHQPPD